MQLHISLRSGTHYPAVVNKLDQCLPRCGPLWSVLHEISWTTGRTNLGLTTTVAWFLATELSQNDLCSKQSNFLHYYRPGAGLQVVNEKILDFRLGKNATKWCVRQLGFLLD